MGTLRLLRRRIAWLFSEPLFWAAVFMAAVSVAVLLLTHPKQELCIRWWGMVLEFVGVGSVAYELRSTQQHFKRPGLREWLAAWLDRWPSRDATAVGASFSGTSNVTCSASGTVGWPKLGPDATADQRFAALERDVAALLERTTTAEHGLACEREDREKADKAEAAKREEDMKDLNAKVEEFAAGSLSFSFFGLVCLGVGLFLTTASSELVKWPSLFGK